MLLGLNGLVPHRFPHQSTAFLGKNSIYIVFNELACDLFSPCLRHDRLQSCAPGHSGPHGLPPQLNRTWRWPSPWFASIRKAIRNRTG